MSVLFDIEKKCKICKTISKHIWVKPCLTYYKPALDLRFSEYDKLLILQVCPTCSYVALDLEIASEEAKMLVNTAHYQSLISDNNYPKPTRHLRACAVINEVDRNNIIAAQLYLRAAWICDDIKRKYFSKRFRRFSYDCIVRGNVGGNYYSSNAQSDSVVKVDLLRRAGELELASSEVSKSIADCSNTDIMVKLLFEQILLHIKDDNCYSEEEAILYFKSLSE